MDREYVRSGVAKVSTVLLGLDRSGLEGLDSLFVSWTCVGEGVAIMWNLNWASVGEVTNRLSWGRWSNVCIILSRVDTAGSEYWARWGDLRGWLWISGHINVYRVNDLDRLG